MAKRKMTKHWEEVKNQYVNCLCYSQEKGLYTKPVLCDEQAEGLLYRPHGYYGYVSDPIDIPEIDLHIQIESNFGYGSMTYLYATLTYKVKAVLNFEIDKLYVLRHSSVMYISVPEYDWNTLFDKIISAYKQVSSGHYQTSSVAYIEELDGMLEQESINVRKTFEKEDPAKWEGDFMIALHAGRKLSDLIKGFDQAAPIDEVLTKHLLDMCRKYVAKIATLSLDLDDVRVSQMSESLHSVHDFMCKKGAGAEYLGIILKMNS